LSLLGCSEIDRVYKDVDRSVNLVKDLVKSLLVILEKIRAEETAVWAQMQSSRFILLYGKRFVLPDGNSTIKISPTGLANERHLGHISTITRVLLFHILFLRKRQKPVFRRQEIFGLPELSPF